MVLFFREITTTSETQEGILLYPSHNFYYLLQLYPIGQNKCHLWVVYSYHIQTLIINNSIYFSNIFY
jgi:hypothetical protein